MILAALFASQALIPLLPTITQNAAEKLSPPALARELFGDLNQDPPEEMASYYISGNGKWPPFVFSRVDLIGLPTQTEEPEICAVNIYDVSLERAGTGGDTMGVYAEKKVSKIDRRTMFIVLQKPVKCKDAHVDTMHNLKEAPSAKALHLAVQDIERLAADSSAVTCADNPCSSEEFAAMRQFDPTSIIRVSAKLANGVTASATLWSVDFYSGGKLGYWSMTYTKQNDHPATAAKLEHVAILPF